MGGVLALFYLLSSLILSLIVTAFILILNNRFKLIIPWGFIYLGFLIITIALVFTPLSNVHKYGNIIGLIGYYGPILLCIITIVKYTYNKEEKLGKNIIKILPWITGLVTASIILSNYRF